MDYIDVRIEQARQAILQQKEQRDRDYRDFIPGPPWNKINQALSYLFEMPVSSLRNVRLHVDYFTGVPTSFDVMHMPNVDGKDFAVRSGYDFLGEGVPERHWASDCQLHGLGDLTVGAKYRGKIINTLTATTQQYICNLWRLNAHEILRRQKRGIVIEIGAGFGLLAQNMQRLASNATYVIVDLPEMLLFSASHLLAQLPEINGYIYSPGDDLESIMLSFDQYDLILIPDYMYKHLEQLPHIDIALNTVSFPEMKTSTVREYLSIISTLLRGDLDKIPRIFIIIAYTLCSLAARGRGFCGSASFRNEREKSAL